MAWRYPTSKYFTYRGPGRGGGSAAPQRTRTRNGASAVPVRQREKPVVHSFPCRASRGILMAGRPLGSSPHSTPLPWIRRTDAFNAAGSVVVVPLPLGVLLVAKHVET